MARIFLCHASEDKPQVREVYQRLKALGFSPWLDEEEILPGQDWDYEIEQRGLPVPEPRAGVPPAAPPAVEGAAEPGEAAAPVGSEGLEEWTNSIGMVFVRIAAGSFTMGSPPSDREAYADEQPPHRVAMTQPFYLGKYPVTQSQWEAVMGANPSHFAGHPNRPVENVSWEDARRFMAALNEREAVSLYRLPTEAQWEYACRAGTDRPRYHTDLDAIAWYAGNSQGQTHEVGQKLPNAWGLHDMLGNVFEWCDDGKCDYTDAAMTDPVGPTHAGAGRVIRGGGWHDGARHARSAYRRWVHPDRRDGYLGFRCLSSGPSQ
jgi:formylglycine-generating enzyme required for sulfatase activity